MEFSLLQEVQDQECEKDAAGEIAVVELPSHNPLVADTRVAIEYCESTAKYGGKASDVYFPSDDEQAKMIKEGGFAVPAYPKCPIISPVRM